LRYAPSTARPARTALPAAHFDRNETYAYFGDRTLHLVEEIFEQKVTKETKTN
jgi:hypothetical protein